MAAIGDIYLFLSLIRIINTCFFPVSKLLPSLLILNECHIFVWQRWRPIQGNVFLYGEVEKQWPQGNLPNYKNRCPLYKRTLVCIIFFLTRTKANKVWISEMQICSKQTRNNDITLIRIEEYVIMFPAKMFVNNLKKSFVFFFSRAQLRRTSWGCGFTSLVYWGLLWPIMKNFTTFVVCLALQIRVWMS